MPLLDSRPPWQKATETHHELPKQSGLHDGGTLGYLAESMESEYQGRAGKAKVAAGSQEGTELVLEMLAGHSLSCTQFFLLCVGNFLSRWVPGFHLRQKKHAHLQHSRCMVLVKRGKVVGVDHRLNLSK